MSLTILSCVSPHRQALLVGWPWLGVLLIPIPILMSTLDQDTRETFWDETFCPLHSAFPSRMVVLVIVFYLPIAALLLMCVGIGLVMYWDMINASPALNHGHGHGHGRGGHCHAHCHAHAHGQGHAHRQGHGHAHSQSGRLETLAERNALCLDGDGGGGGGGGGRGGGGGGGDWAEPPAGARDSPRADGGGGDDRANGHLAAAAGTTIYRAGGGILEPGAPSPPPPPPPAAPHPALRVTDSAEFGLDAGHDHSTTDRDSVVQSRFSDSAITTQDIDPSVILVGGGGGEGGERGGRAGVASSSSDSDPDPDPLERPGHVLVPFLVTVICALPLMVGWWFYERMERDAVLIVSVTLSRVYLLRAALLPAAWFTLPELRHAAAALWDRLNGRNGALLGGSGIRRGGEMGEFSVAYTTLRETGAPGEERGGSATSGGGDGGRGGGGGVVVRGRDVRRQNPFDSDVRA